MNVVNHPEGFHKLDKVKQLDKFRKVFSQFQTCLYRFFQKIVKTFGKFAKTRCEQVRQLVRNFFQLPNFVFVERKTLD